MATFDRRRLLAAAAASGGRILGASERIVIAQIGVGARGHYELTLCQKIPGVEIAAVCDPYRPLLEATVAALGPRVQAYDDFRRVLDRKDIDAVFVSTPDHWHAPISILACQAGKDVYCEKPLTHRIAEGPAMVKAARKYNRVVQTGSQQRSGPQFARVRDLIAKSYIGRVSRVECWNVGNASPEGVGVVPDSDPPPGLNWDLYLGPAPKVPYNRNRFIWHYRWFWDYSGGMLTDWGAHHLDSIHQVMGVDTPRAVTASGGRVLKDTKETPDFVTAMWEYPGFTVTYMHSGVNKFAPYGRGYGMAFHGTLGTILVDRSSFEVVPENRAAGPAGDRDMVEDMLASRRASARTSTGAPPPSTSVKQSAAVQGAEPLKETGIRMDPDYQIVHIRNWLDCIRSRQTPVADWQIGHRSIVPCHLAVIAYRTGRRIRWDASTETIVGDPEAANWLSKTYRAPWGGL